MKIHKKQDKCYFLVPEPEIAFAKELTKRREIWLIFHFL